MWNELWRSPKRHREALKAIAGPASRSSSFQLGLAVLPYLDGDDVAAAIVAHERDLEAQLEALEERIADLEELDERRAGQLPFHVAAMFDLGVTQTGAELAWIRRFAADFDHYRRTERTRR